MDFSSGERSTRRSTAVIFSYTSGEAFPNGEGKQNIG